MNNNYNHINSQVFVTLLRHEFKYLSKQITYWRSPSSRMWYLGVW